MKYKLETIPVWDALKEDTECPFCLHEEAAEERYVKYYLGNSAMNPETRVEVNEKGFCPEHFEKLLKGRGPQHLGLMVHTHMENWKESLEKNYPTAGQSGINRLLKPKSSPVEAYSDHVNSRLDSCLICERIGRTLKRYTYTTVYLWQKDEESFREVMENSKGVCVKHERDLLLMAEEILNSKEQEEFFSYLKNIQLRNYERLEKELFWFTQKFKAENHSQPWGTSEDAHYRVIQKLTGHRSKVN